MVEIGFYHLQDRSLEDALPPLLEKILERGFRAVIETTSRERAEALDDHLWTYGEGSFLPHAIARGAPPADPTDPVRDERQPLLITAEAGVGEAPVRVLVDGARLPEAMKAYERIVLMFDGDDAQAVAEARAQWREVKARGLPATYWRRAAGGGWTRQG